MPGVKNAAHAVVFMIARNGNGGKSSVRRIHFLPENAARFRVDRGPFANRSGRGGTQRFEHQFVALDRERAVVGFVGLKVDHAHCLKDPCRVDRNHLPNGTVHELIVATIIDMSFRDPFRPDPKVIVVASQVNLFSRHGGGFAADTDPSRTFKQDRGFKWDHDIGNPEGRLMVRKRPHRRAVTINRRSQLIQRRRRRKHGRQHGFSSGIQPLASRMKGERREDGDHDGKAGAPLRFSAERATKKVLRIVLRMEHVRMIVDGLVNPAVDQA